MWGFIFCGMNINSILDGINLVTRGRFSAKGGAAWIKWMGMVLSRIESECPGVGAHTKVSALPMDSGFIPTPPGIKQITGLFVDDEEIKYDRNHVGIWPMFVEGEERELTSQTLSATLTAADPKTLSILLNDEEIDLVNGTGLKTITIMIQSYNAASKTGTFIATSDDDLSELAAGVGGYRIILFGEVLTIESSAVVSLAAREFTFETTFSGSYDVNDLAIVPLVGFRDGQFDGWSAVAGKHQIELFKTTWVHPTYGSAWSSASEFLASRKIIGQTFAQSQGYIFTSNVKVSGYSSIQRPSTLTEEINLDTAYEQLLSDGLYMMAERDSDPSSNEAITRTQIFEQALKMYRIDQAQAAFKSAPKKFTSTPRLGAKNRGW